MKTIIKYLAIAASTVALYGCQDEYSDINPDARPTASDINVELTMLDSNKVVFNLLNSECTPIWYFNDGTQSTINGITKQFLMAGDYSVEIKMYNRNGICDGSIVREFSFDKTFASFEKEEQALTGGGEAIWQIAQYEAGHLACGPSPESPAEWWKAAVSEKAAYGLYDDKFIFNADGTYTYNPGDDGLTYVNYGSTVLGIAPGTEDIDVPTSEMKGTWNFEFRGTDLYLVLSPKTVLGYLTSDAQYEKPEFLVKKVDAKKITLIYVGDGISWQYILAPEGTEPPAAQPEVSFVENPAGDILADVAASWKTATYHGDGNWGEMGDWTVTPDGTNYKIHYKNASDGQWKAQFRLISQYLTEAGQKYDIRVKVKSDGFIPQATFKVLSVDEKNVNFTGDGIRKDIEDDAVTEFVINGVSAENAMEITEREGSFDDGSGVQQGGLTILLDFGGNPENCNVEIFDIAIQKSK